jgi:hypothetical protein
MPDPVLAFHAVKFLWDESRSVRSSLWQKLPFAKDTHKRNIAEQELGQLLEDASKLAKGLTAHQAEDAIEKRLGQFEQTLLEAKIPADQATILVDRAAVMVRLIVTEPVIESGALRLRLADLEASIQTLEASNSELRLKLEEHAATLQSRAQDKSLLALWVGFGLLAILEIVQIFALLLRSGGVH